jgi:hypothetical protein
VMKTPHQVRLWTSSARWRSSAGETKERRCRGGRTCAAAAIVWGPTLRAHVTGAQRGGRVGRLCWAVVGGCAYPWQRPRGWRRRRPGVAVVAVWVGMERGEGAVHHAGDAACRRRRGIDAAALEVTVMRRLGVRAVPGERCAARMRRACLQQAPPSPPTQSGMDDVPGTEPRMTTRLGSGRARGGW